MSSIREAQQVWAAMERAEQRKARTALLTLVSVRGSAYRRPGAKMMMASDGEMFGTLSGGCLEGDLYHYAEQAMASMQPAVRYYDLTEDAMWGLGIGCKGTIMVWIEPVELKSQFWQQYGALVEQDRPFVMEAKLPVGIRRLHPQIRAEELSELPEEVRSWRSMTHYRDDVVYDILVPPERLIVVGAGHDAVPLVALANQAGFEVTVLDPRPHFNTAKKLPQAARHWVQQVGDVDPDTVQNAYWIIMNHHESRDRSALDLAMKSHPQYVGMLGPHSRTLDLLGDNPIPDVLRSPVGLSIGAETVEEVAVSIVAELLAHRNGKSGGPLNGHQRIHD
ncbi:MAG: xanthine dehydrogenase [Sulfobacillus benefaciens]|uniref:Xanthine dehydrogenase n=1 Tax=Sulfobacillus benefaciens TaxID=453960 RepID=A0A2T2XJX6_9FIRM|nr:MAG: xanthine dehydrogenase [Sulfobacillus benefaciens]